MDYLSGSMSIMMHLHILIFHETSQESLPMSYNHMVSESGDLRALRKAFCNAK